MTLLFILLFREESNIRPQVTCLYFIEMRIGGSKIWRVMSSKEIFGIHELYLFNLKRSQHILCTWLLSLKTTYKIVLNKVWGVMFEWLYICERNLHWKLLYINCIYISPPFPTTYPHTLSSYHAPTTFSILQLGKPSQRKLSYLP